MFLKIALVAIVILVLAALIIPFVFRASGVKVFHFAAVGGRGISGTGVVWRSQDAGVTWEEAEERDSSEKFPSRILDVAFHPRDAEIVYLGTKSSGLWRSSDAGRTWERAVDQGGMLQPDADVYGIAIIRENPSIIYLAVFQERRGRVLKSDDEGKTFREIYVATPTQGPVYDIYVASSTPQHLFVTTGQKGLLESRDGGTYWKMLQWFREPVVELAVNPFFPNEMYAVDRRGDLKKSFDGGASWIDLGEGVGKAADEGKLFGPDPGVFAGDFFAHPGTKTFLMDPRIPSRLFLGSKAGLFRSSHGGSGWEKIPLPIPPASIEVGAIARDPRNAATLFAGVGPELYRSDDGGTRWRIIPLPTKSKITRVAIHPLRPEVMLMVVGR